MPSTVKVRIRQARNLPVMDNANNRHHASSGVGRAVGAINNLRNMNIPSTSSSGGNHGNNNGIHGVSSTDAYVVVTLGGHVNLTDQEEESGKQKRYTQKTRVCKRTLNPVWDEGRHWHWCGKWLRLCVFGKSGEGVRSENRRPIQSNPMQCNPKTPIASLIEILRSMH